MKKLKTLLKTMFVFALTLTMFSNVTSMTSYAAEYAYHSEDYEIVGTHWKMDNKHGHTQHVNMYMLIENDAYYTMNKANYNFYCYSPLTEGDKGVFTLEDGTIVANFSYNFLAANGKEITTIGNGTVYEFTFGLLPGDYTFAPCDGNSGTQMGDLMITLTDNLCHPGVGFGYYDEDPWLNPEVKDEVVTIEEGKNHNIYVMYGSTEFCWVDEEVTEFINWAKEHKASYENINDGSGETETIETPSTTEEPTLSFGNETTEDNTDTDTNITETTETEVEVTNPVVVKSKPNLGWLGILGAVAVIGVAVVIFIKKKNS